MNQPLSIPALYICPCHCVHWILTSLRVFACSYLDRCPQSTSLHTGCSAKVSQNSQASKATFSSWSWVLCSMYWKDSNSILILSSYFNRTVSFSGQWANQWRNRRIIRCIISYTTEIPELFFTLSSPQWYYACVAGGGPGGLPTAWRELCTGSFSLLALRLPPEQTGSTEDRDRRTKGLNIFLSSTTVGKTWWYKGGGGEGGNEQVCK